MLKQRHPFASVMSSRTQMQAMALAGVLNSVVVEPTPFHLRSTAPVFRRLPAHREPLDLTATVFRYLRHEDGLIEPMRTYAANFCRCKSRISQRWK